jgi:hypothetical protein
VLQDQRRSRSFRHLGASRKLPCGPGVDTPVQNVARHWGHGVREPCEKQSPPLIRPATTVDRKFMRILPQRQVLAGDFSPRHIVKVVADSSARPTDTRMHRDVSSFMTDDGNSHLSPCDTAVPGAGLTASASRIE